MTKPIIFKTLDEINPIVKDAFQKQTIEKRAVKKYTIEKIVSEERPYNKFIMNAEIFMIEAKANDVDGEKGDYLVISEIIFNKDTNEVGRPVTTTVRKLITEETNR